LFFSRLIELARNHSTQRFAIVKFFRATPLLPRPHYGFGGKGKCAAGCWSRDRVLSPL